MYRNVINKSTGIVHRKCNGFRTLNRLTQQNYDKDRISVTDLQMDTRKGFGSFHSEDIEVLIKQPLSNNDYNSIIPNDIQQHHQDHLNYESLTYGKQMKENLFMLDPQYNFLNHGAFGNTLIPLLKESHLWSTYW